MAVPMKPGNLSASELDSINSFARSLPPVRGHIAAIKKKHRPEDVVEVGRQLRVLVKDTARKLQTTLNRLKAEQVDEASDAEATEPESKC
jgi:hypothetical protein